MSELFEAATDLSRLLKDLPQIDREAYARALRRQGRLTKPPGSLGRLEEIAVFLAGWQGDSIRATRIQVTLFAGNHGVTKQGVSPYPPEVTAQMVANFQAGGAAISALAKEFALSLSVFPLSLDRPTGDISTEDAMSDEETLAALNVGAGAVDADSDILVVGEMGIGNTTVAAALCASALGGKGADWTGAGTGLDAAGIAHKAEIVDRALARQGAAPGDAFTRLQRLGGRELAAMAGAVCAARLRRIPVVLDGFVACAAMAPLFAQEAAILDHCLAGHRSAERGHTRLLQAFKLEPILELGMRLGEGSGAAVATAIISAAVATHTRMATFESAGVSDREA